MRHHPFSTLWSTLSPFGIPRSSPNPFPSSQPSRLSYGKRVIIGPRCHYGVVAFALPVTSARPKQHRFGKLWETAILQVQNRQSRLKSTNSLDSTSSKVCRRSKLDGPPFFGSKTGGHAMWSLGRAQRPRALVCSGACGSSLGDKKGMPRPSGYRWRPFGVIAAIAVFVAEVASVGFCLTASSTCPHGLCFCAGSQPVL
jgi:hypothetical protein